MSIDTRVTIAMICGGLLKLAQYGFIAWVILLLLIHNGVSLSLPPNT